MSEHGEDMPEVPMVQLNEDELRTIARDVAENHGIEEDPPLDEIVRHAVPILQNTRGDIAIPTQDSVRMIQSLIRRASIAVELPAELVEPTVTLSEDECRAWARFMVAVFGADIDSALVRRCIADEVVGELDESSVDAILGMISEAQVRVRLPGDKRFMDAPYPGEDRPQ